METRPSDNVSGCGTGEIIRDMSRSSFLWGASVTPEQHLMHLAGDPLLVHALVQRSGSGGPVGQMAPAASGDTAVALAGTALGLGEQVGANAPVVRRYEDPGGGAATSIFPSAFHATAQDRRDALDVDLLHAEDPEGSDASSIRYVCLVLMAFAAAALLLFVPA